MVTKNRLKDKVRPVARQMAGIGNVYRLAIVYLLASGELLSREIVAALGLPQNLVSHHLKILVTTGWIRRERTGRKVTYTLNEKAFLSLQKLLADTYFGRRILSSR
ncbi:winged helix-turn-helix transcriptional regulator [Candidatus Gottesmanbacteria bacterium]|nr:winged helix-turn-helix transcriptional regulator [Candidatus Gottesmanbacteria bacterium]